MFKGIFGDGTQKLLSSAKPIVLRINALEEDLKALDDSAFPVRTVALKERLVKGESLDDILPEAFALVREASRRTLGQRHYDVQLVGGIALHRGNIAEMRTGEGKTLVATLPAYLNALTGKGVHVVTVNDYLARRDAVWMSQVYNFLGLSVGVINSQGVSFIYDPTHTEKDAERDGVAIYKVVYEFLRPASRRQAYACDITYGTNNEYGFDYLRDNLAGSEQQLSQREHNFAIVDEIDSILIDEARTPLIISNEAEESEGFYRTFADIAGKLSSPDDYSVDEKHKATQLTDAGITKAETLLGISNIYTEKGIKYVHHLETAVRASALFQKDRDYVVRDGEVVIVDPFTGRMQPGRRWNEGLHQAIEAKEGVNIQKETRTAASITFQNYFRFYSKLSGMTGTGKTSEEEFRKVYGLDVISIPTHRTSKRIDHNDLIFQTEKGKWQAIAKVVREKHEKGQPVLIGTISIERNELLSAYLREAGVPHTVLNAKNHEKEGELIAQAGKRGAVTVATNMAGRGIDIILGGLPASDESRKEIQDLGGLFVIGTERHEARRIDNQLRGRAGRQGDPGETQFFVSLEDDLMRVFGSDRIKKMMGRFGIPEDEAIENKLITSSLESAQKKIEGFHFDARKYTLEYDNVLSHQRGIVYARRRRMLLAKKEDILAYIDEFTKTNEEIIKLFNEKRGAVGDDTFIETFRRIVLHVTDMLWTEHLETMDYSRSSVNLRAYGGREPLVEYQKEGLQLFRHMENAFREQVVGLVGTISVNTTDSLAPEPEKAPVKYSEFHQEPEELTGNRAQAEQSSYDGKREADSLIPPKQASEGPKAGRNDPCPCGSGKKFKKCHGA
ncbi:MAG: preprotein translocase subunit SecA [Candidatus Pacebacteria bacterium]|nr:preprotein translocase subunit SecA [Candidatus Paceibacterota bacterium]